MTKQGILKETNHDNNDDCVISDSSEEEKKKCPKRKRSRFNSIRSEKFKEML